MKKLPLFCIVLLCTQFIYAQSNFSKVIDLGVDFQQGHNVLIDDEIIYVLAEREVTGADVNGGTLFRMDEIGNTLFQLEIDSFEIGLGDNMVQLEDDLILISGHSNDEDPDTSHYVLVFDAVDVTDQIFQFHVGSTFGEIKNNGFLSPQDESNINSITYGTNKEGNMTNGFLVSISSDDATVDELISFDEGFREYNIVRAELLNDTTMIYVADVVLSGTSLGARTIRTRTMSGAIEKIWESPFQLDLGTDTDFVILNDGGYAVVAPNTENSVSTLSPFIYFLDAEGNEVKTFEFPTDVSGLEARNVYDIDVAQNGDIIGIGSIENEEVGREIGWIFRITTDGELLWERSYSEFDWFNESYRESNLFKIAEMSDGSLVGTGYVKQSAFAVSNDDVWILKVDGEGCFSPGNCGFEQNVSSTSESNQDLIHVFPNPVRDILFLDVENVVDFQLYDLGGRLMIQGNDNHIDVGFLQAAPYILEIQLEDGRKSYASIIKM